MKTLIALLILGYRHLGISGRHRHSWLVDGATGHTVVSEQQDTSRPMISGTFSRYRDLGRAGFGLRYRRLPWNKLNSSNPVW